MRLRPIGEMGLKAERVERVRCWKCHTSFEVGRAVVRIACPECGSQVALHRLRMPVMPCGSQEDQVVRLPAGEGNKGREREIRDRESAKQMPVLKKGEEVSVMSGEENTSKKRNEWRAPIEPRRRTEEGQEKTEEGREKIEERREKMFCEAEPCKEGGRDELAFSGITFKTLIVSIGLAALLLLVVVFFVMGGR